MKNIPNPKEYLMVCKVVDDGLEKYKEYVLLVKNDNLHKQFYVKQYF